MLSLSDIWYSDAIGYVAIYQISGIALSTESHPAMSVTNGSLIYLLLPDIEQNIGYPAYPCLLPPHCLPGMTSGKF